jgi:hypothetical protein
MCAGSGIIDLTDLFPMQKLGILSQPRGARINYL